MFCSLYNQLYTFQSVKSVIDYSWFNTHTSTFIYLKSLLRDRKHEPVLPPLRKTVGTLYVCVQPCWFPTNSMKHGEHHVGVSCLTGFYTSAGVFGSFIDWFESKAPSTFATWPLWTKLPPSSDPQSRTVLICCSTILFFEYKLRRKWLKRLCAHKRYLRNSLGWRQHCSGKTWAAAWVSHFPAQLSTVPLVPLTIICLTL